MSSPGRRDYGSVGVEGDFLLLLMLHRERPSCPHERGGIVAAAVVIAEEVRISKAMHVKGGSDVDGVASREEPGRSRRMGSVGGQQRPPKLSARKEEKKVTDKIHRQTET